MHLSEKNFTYKTLRKKRNNNSELADVHLEIPMHGIKQSLNVSVATGIIGYELLRKYKSKL